MEASCKPRGFSISLNRVSQPTRFTAAGAAKQSTTQSCVYFMIIAINYNLAIARGSLSTHPMHLQLNEDSPLKDSKVASWCGSKPRRRPLGFSRCRT